MNITTRGKVAIGGALTGLALLVFTASPIAAQTPPTQPNAPITHQQMDQMMTAMLGADGSQRMHAAMGPNGEQLMDQCVSMMGMMQNMQGMMNGNMSGMMNGNMSGMMNGQNGQSMQNMMPNATGQ